MTNFFKKITHRNGYTKSDIKLIQEAAKKHQMEIIPLIQTFGHLEWILKLHEFKSYRDDRNLPLVISPCLNATYILFEGYFEFFSMNKIFIENMELFRSLTTNIGYASE